MSAIEHKSVLETCKALERQGFAVTYLLPRTDGRIDPIGLADALRADTLLVSLMHVNNETGAIQPIQECAELLADKGVLFHVDADQSVGKFALDLSRTQIDLLSFSAHKIYGPKGIGVLIVRNRPSLRMQPLMYGGGQEHGLRPGTLPTHQIMGLSEALRCACESRETDFSHVSRLRKCFISQLQRVEGLCIHGSLNDQSPYIVNFSVAGLDADALINHLRPDIAIASGSACTSGAIEPSHVLRAMGIEGDLLYGAVRVSFNRHTTEADVTGAANRILTVAAEFSA